jgi:hypothetical protein
MLQTLPCEIRPDLSEYYQKMDYYPLKGIRIRLNSLLKP